MAKQDEDKKKREEKKDRKNSGKNTKPVTVDDLGEAGSVYDYRRL